MLPHEFPPWSKVLLLSTLHAHLAEGETQALQGDFEGYSADKLLAELDRKNDKAFQDHAR